ncbi:hypothetical protein BAE44_0024582 [Dichanthelium oligosanthes]|uniref:Uncharacterized protein n=1 Tax=Dichanthelium oligosanthes TaxID=888268 RepID=A0A1E5UNE7_9POAL|nr:hypothetical protein BAE44_0024582 [Dichanthelium oligosanthes]
MSGDRMRAAMLSLALVGLLLLGHLTAAASAKNNVHVLSVGETASGGGSDSDEGRLVYADMKMAKTRSGSTDAPVPAPAPGPSASDE